jgi:hypothetical protein
MAVEPQRHAVADTLSAAGENRSAVRPVMEGMDDAARREQLTQHWEYAASDQDIAHEIYHEDAILEFPQSGERFVGVENFREWRSNYPASTAFDEPRDDKIARESIYVTEGWEPPAWRAQWRAAP